MRCLEADGSIEGGEPISLSPLHSSERPDGRSAPLHPDGFSHLAGRRRPSRLHAVPRAERCSIQMVVKRGLDIVGAGLLLLLLSPLFLAIVALIRLTSRGPAFFRQVRTGRHNVPFEILKFRSMYTERCDVSGIDQTVSNDPRVTPIGRLLRRTNLDELPQLINVLKGDMSLIGPRPHVPGMLAAGMAYEELVPFYAGRHQMRPGITGLAQAQGLRGPTTDPEPATLRIVRDIEYVQNFSLWLDVKIVVWTIAHELMTSSGF